MAQHPNRIEIVSSGKVNLTLEVGARRADGYHEIDSVAQVVDLADRLTLEDAPVGVIEVAVDGGDAPEGPRNLVHLAAEAFFRATGVRGGARFRLAKRIPAQAGLGGGSGNAAAALIALDRLYATGLTRAELSSIAATVGSDAALFVYGGTVRVRGRGDLIEPLPDAPELRLVIVKPDVGVSTAWAYAELDKTPERGNRGASDRAEEAVRAGDREGLIDGMWNDFDSVVSEAFDEIREAKSVLAQAGARRVMLCGSGSAVFGVFGSPRDADQAAEAVRSRFPESFVTRSLSRAEAERGKFAE